MDAGFNLLLWGVRLGFLLLLWLVVALVARALVRDVRAAACNPSAALGRLVVVASGGQPAPGTVFALDAVTTIGRDLGSSVVLDDPYASTHHAVLTFRGRGWYVEDLGSTNGTFVDGTQIAGLASLGYGAEIQVGEVRLRLERGRA